MSDVSKVVNDAGNLFKAAIDKLRGKHGADPETEALLNDMEKLATSMQQVVAVAEADGPGLVADGVKTAGEATKVAAEVAAKDVPGLIADVPAVVAQLVKDVGDLKKAWKAFADLSAKLEAK